jgi:hypothetical protein
MPSLTSAAKSVKKATRREVVTPGGSDETAVDEEGDVVEESVGTELREQDLAEQRDMIADLKAQRDKALAVKHRGSTDDTPAKLKRAREDESKKLEFEFKEPEIGERVIATNRRITPSQKSVVWGVMAFAFGMTAVYVQSLLALTSADFSVDLSCPIYSDPFFLFTLCYLFNCIPTISV